MTITSFNAGFYLPYLWSLRQEIEKSLDLDLPRQLKILSSFTLSETGGNVVERKPNRDAQRLIAIYSNLLSRGLPTFSSLLVEKAILGFVGEKLPIQEIERAGTLRFINGRVNQMVEENWFAALRKAHHLCDPRLSLDQFDPRVFQAHRDQPYDSEKERLFYENYLPERIDPALIPFVEPQRSIASMVSEPESQLFINQRVDFALEAGNIRAVFEVDGPQHLIDPQKSLDQDRDRALRNNQWHVIRVPIDCIDGDGKPAQISAEWEQLLSALQADRTVQNINELSSDPLWSNEFGLPALVAVFSPFGIARFQKSLLLALQDGLLSLEDEVWKLVVVEQDIPFAQLGLVDFLQHIHAFQKLMGIAPDNPKIELIVYQTEPFSGFTIQLPGISLQDYGIDAVEITLGQSDPFDTYNGDWLVDLAVLSPTNYRTLTTEFIKRHLHSQGSAYTIRSMLRPVENRRLRAQLPEPFIPGESADEALRFFLQNIFRKKEFREGQLEILRRAITLRPVIGLLPTGAGKSLCYQLAALLQPGLTLVIDPLLSLMADQMENLSENFAIDWVGFFNSQQTFQEREETARRMLAGEVLFVFVSPERFQNIDFRGTLTHLTQTYPVAYAVIDEAHCVSEWGHDFRTSYLKLGKTITTFCRYRDQPPAIIALTGTASYSVLSDVQREIGVEEESAKVYPSNFERKELVFSFESVPSKEKKHALVQKFRGLPHLFNASETFFTLKGEDTNSGLVFTPHVNGEYGVLQVRNLLAVQFSMPVEYFSGEVPVEKKKGKRIPVKLPEDYQDYKMSTQHAFKSNEFPVLVATKAFGMGIDKPNIRYTVHFNIPQSLESLYQEAGRAGRDRQTAQCIIMFSDDKAKQANRLLQPNVTSQQIQMALENNWGGGDIHRLLYLFTRTFRGIQEEMELTRKILNQILRRLARSKTVESVSMTIDFGSDSEQQARDKALYRLSILGVVSDYTVDHHGRKFQVTAVKLSDQATVDHLQDYIKRYKTREVSDLVPELVRQESGDTTLEKSLSYLLKFVYQEIERKRRAAIKTMADLARSAARIRDPDQQNRYAWEQMLAYLEHSIFTEDLIKLSNQIDPDQWLEILHKQDETGAYLLQSVDGVRQLLGGCRRALESDTENPGLLFLSALARLLLPDPEIHLAMQELRASLTFLEVLPPDKQEQVGQTMLQELHEWLQNTKNFQAFQQEYANAFLDVLPSRSIARVVHPLLPKRSENILLNLMLTRLQRFTADSLVFEKHPN